jgi:hypothetical protein
MKTKRVKAQYLKQGDTILHVNDMGYLREPRIILKKERTRRHFSRGTAYHLTLPGHGGATFTVLALGEDEYDKIVR